MLFSLARFLFIISFFSIFSIRHASPPDIFFSLAFEYYDRHYFFISFSLIIRHYFAFIFIAAIHAIDLLAISRHCRHGQLPFRHAAILAIMPLLR
jgi:hypothetical protein